MLCFLFYCFHLQLHNRPSSQKKIWLSLGYLGDESHHAHFKHLSYPFLIPVRRLVLGLVPAVPFTFPPQALSSVRNSLQDSLSNCGLRLPGQ